MISGVIALAMVISSQWPEKEWAFKDVELGVTSQIREPAVHVMRNDEELRAYMRLRGDVRRPLPKIDWTLNQVIGLHGGEMPTGGYGLKVLHVWKRPYGAEVEYIVTKPSPDMMVTQVLTYPFAMIRTEKFQGRVETKLSEESG